MTTQPICISAAIRTKLSKGANRKFRKTEHVPAVLYQKQQNINLIIPFKNLPKGHTGSQTIELELEGKKYPVLMREVQIDPLTSGPIHIDFQEVQPDSVVTSRVPLEFVGLTREQEKECMFQVLVRAVSLRGKVSEFPASIKVNISSLKADETAHFESSLVPAGLKMRDSGKLALAKLVRK